MVGCYRDYEIPCIPRTKMYIDVDTIDNSLVREVFDVINQDRLFRPTEEGRQRASDRFTVIDSYDDVLDYLGGGVLMPYSFSRTEGEVRMVSWTDIAGDQGAIANGLKYEAGVDKLADELCRVDELAALIDAHLLSDFRDTLDSVLADLTDCIGSRLAVGTGNPWAEDVFVAYHCGGFPCGWDNENKRLIVFIPPLEQ